MARRFFVTVTKNSQHKKKGNGYQEAYPEPKKKNFRKVQYSHHTCSNPSAEQNQKKKKKSKKNRVSRAKGKITSTFSCGSSFLLPSLPFLPFLLSSTKKPKSEAIVLVLGSKIHPASEAFSSCGRNTICQCVNGIFDQENPKARHQFLCGI